MNKCENVKILLEEKELETLSPFAQKSVQTKGREVKEPPSLFETEYQLDRSRIVNCKAFRRLKHKTQVFFAPNDDHYRTRLTHTLEVSLVARAISKALGLNEDLTEAIAMGHDLGHTPFGHSGEQLLNEIMIEGFSHNEQSVRIVKYLEKLNLTAEVIDGILNHNGNNLASTLEGRVVKFADKIAYVNHDIEDTIRAGIIKDSDLPADCLEYFSADKTARTQKMVYNIIEASMGKNEISMSEEGYYYFSKLRSWMYENVYLTSEAKREEDSAKRVVQNLFYYYMDKLKKSAQNWDEVTAQRCVCDYVSGMSDRYAIQKYTEFFMPKFTQKENNDDYLFEIARESGLTE